MKRNLLGTFAVVLAIAFSAFTTVQKLDSDLVWYQVDETTGQAVSASNGIQGDTPPAGLNCLISASKFCARALSISENEVVSNGNGTYSIASGVDITSAFNAQRFKN